MKKKTLIDKERKEKEIKKRRYGRKRNQKGKKKNKKDKKEVNLLLFFDIIYCLTLVLTR